MDDLGVSAKAERDGDDGDGGLLAGAQAERAALGGRVVPDGDDVKMMEILLTRK